MTFEIAIDELGIGNDRTAYVMELNERYCDVIVKRWEEQTGEKAVLDGGLRK